MTYLLRHRLFPAYILLSLVFIGSFYFHLNQGGTGFRIPNNIMVWLFAALFGFYSLWRFTKQDRFYLPQHFLLFISFPLLAIYGGFFSGVEVPDIWIFRLLYIWGGVLFLLSLYQYRLTARQTEWVLILIVGVAFIHAIVGISQIVWVHQMPSWLPSSPSGIPAGLFQQINNQASFQVTALVIALWLCSRPIISQRGILPFILILSTITTTSFVIGYSGSRIGFLGLIISVPLLFVSRWSFIKQRKPRWAFITLTLVSSILLSNVFENQRGLTSVLEKTTAINAGFSGSARLGMYSIALDLVKQAPLSGHGIGSFVRVWQLAKPDFFAAHPEASSTLPMQRVSHPHNELILWLVEGGVIAASGLVLFLTAILLTLWNLPSSRRYAYLALLVPIGLHTQVELPFYISAVHWFVFLFLIFFISRHHTTQYRKRLSFAANTTVKYLSVLFGAVAFVFFSHTFASCSEFKPQYRMNMKHDTFSYAMNNPYFENLAMEQTMLAMFYASMKYGLDNNVQVFAEWGEETLEHNPHILFYITTARAYAFLKQRDKVCEIVQLGASIYPKDKDLQDFVQSCVTD